MRRHLPSAAGAPVLAFLLTLAVTPVLPARAADVTALSGRSVQALAAFAGTTVAGTDDGAYVENPDGTWAPAAGTMAVASVNALADSGGRLFAATDGGVMSSADGVQWTAAGLTGSRIVALNAWTGSLLAGTGTDSGADGMAYRSDDGGATWAPAVAVPALVGLPGPTVGAILGGTVGALAGTDGRGVYRSADARGGWVATGTGPGFVTSLLPGGGAILAGTDDGLYTSADRGGTWTSVALPQPDVWAQTLAQDGTGHVLLGTYDGGVYRQVAPGQWTAVAAGLSSVLSLLPRGDGGLWVGTFDGLTCLGCPAPTATATPAAEAAGAGSLPASGQHAAEPGTTPSGSGAAPRSAPGPAVSGGRVDASTAEGPAARSPGAPPGEAVAQVSAPLAAGASPGSDKAASPALVHAPTSGIVAGGSLGAVAWIAVLLLLAGAILAVSRWRQRGRSARSRGDGR